MKSSGDWQLTVDPQVYKALKKIPQKDIKKVLAAIEALGANPYAGDIQKMAGEQSVWRRRVGEYRLFFEILVQEKVLHVFWVERRTAKTY